jgi:hypothetical protein
MTRASLLYLFAAASFAVVMHPAAHAQDRVTMYYANAYADHYGVPRALVDAIIEQESDWNHLAQSVKDAEGLMQLMPATAAAYGIRNRYDILGKPRQNNAHRKAALAAFRKHWGKADLENPPMPPTELRAGSGEPIVLRVERKSQSRSVNGVSAVMRFAESTPVNHT